ncbi:MAG TPA: hypothetical protein VNE39_06130, partial [Planctomycetota bacterium]|nr:hypothetical protein [Planctomycetota bacterium]
MRGMRGGFVAVVLVASLGLCGAAEKAGGAKALTREQVRALHQPGIYLPPIFGTPSTPETRTLSEAEAEGALERDWLFQAMGEALLTRAAKEIAWTRELAERLARGPKPPDLSAELAELATLERTLAEVTTKGTAERPVINAAAGLPSWIWFPEGKPVEDAPAEARFFRCTFDLPAAGVRAAELRISADDACEVFLNGTRLGANDAWQRAAAFAVAKHLKPGRNVLAVRAQNNPFAGKNPAGLIALLPITLADGKPMAVVSNASWRAEKAERAGWQEPAFDDSAWAKALVAAPLGGGPWGRIAGLGGPEDATSAYADIDPEVRGLY